MHHGTWTAKMRDLTTGVRRATAGVKRAQVRSHGLREGARWAVLVSGSTDRVFQGSGHEFLQEAWPNEFFFFGLCWCLLPRRADPKSRFYHLHHPRSRVRLVFVVTEGLVKRTQCLLVSAIQTLYNLHEFRAGGSGL